MPDDPKKRFRIATLGAWLGLSIWTIVQLAIGNAAALPSQTAFQLFALLAVVLGTMALLRQHRS